MTNTTPPGSHTIQLPSDQDASGRTLGQEEIKLLTQAIESGRLFGPRGRFVKEVEALFAQTMGVEHAYACTSGTAAVHTAIAAIDPEPGDEIITTPITDMGALSPIPYQGAIPVFADVDPITCNVTADTIADRISDRTKAIIVTHLFGSPCNMTEIMELAESRSIPVIEDCAQALLAEHGGRKVGTFGAISCFSLQQGKHITTGEGGLMIVNDPALARRSFLYINKAWGYGDENPDHYFLALNYRLSELQGAVALAQLPKLADGVRRRVEGATALSEALQGMPGIITPPVPEGDLHTFWRYCLHVDADVIEGGCRGLAGALKDRGIFAGAGYIQKPSFMCEVFRDQRTFGNSRWPFTLARPEAVDYDPARFPGAFKGLEGILVFPWNERYNDEHVGFIADGIREAVAGLTR
jgi:dTDP-4-amino-4,6-dideoxygalactose transaminase